MLRSIITAVSAAGLVLLSPVAQAAEREVRTSDLDLSTVKGQAQLDSRIARAAREACSTATTGSRLKTVDADCAARARAMAREALAAQSAAANRGG